MIIWVVVSNIFYFHPYLGKIPILTNIFQRGWFNRQLVMFEADPSSYQLMSFQESQFGMMSRDVTKDTSFTRNDEK